MTEPTRTEVGDEFASGAGTHLRVESAWNYLSVEARSAEHGKPATITAFLTMLR